MRIFEDHQTIKEVPGGKWAISREVQPNVFIYLVERTPVTDVELTSSEVVAEALLYVGLSSPTIEETDRYFPRNKFGEHCPTFEFMKKWCEAYVYLEEGDILNSVGV